jgi:hypothetical protein
LLREDTHLLHHLEGVERVGVHPLDLEKHAEGLHVTGSSFCILRNVWIPLAIADGDAGALVLQHEEVPGDACGKVAQLGLDRKLGEKRTQSPFLGESFDIQIILQSCIPSA